MVEVGKLTIGGSIDTTMIEAGFRKIQQGFTRVSGFVKGFGSDMVRIGKSTLRFAKTLGLIAGPLGVGVFTALASKAPAVAPAIAKMGVEFLKISHTLGRIMAPAFESIANELLPAISHALETHSGKITSFVNLVTTASGDMARILRGDVKEIDQLISKIFFIGGGAVLGGITGGPTGAVTGAAAGAAVRGFIVPNVSDEEREMFGVFAESRQSEVRFTQLILQGRSVAAATEFFKFRFNKFIDTIEFLTGLGGRENDRKMELTDFYEEIWG